MQKMYFSPYSETGWEISPPSLEMLITDYESMQNDSTAFVDIKARYSFQRANPIGFE